MIFEAKPNLRLMRNELTQWGIWARMEEINPSAQTYRSPAFSMMLLKDSVSQNSPSLILSDETLLAIDALVNQLKLSRPDLYQWIEFHYLKGYPVTVLAQKTKLTRYKIDSFIMAGESWLESRLTAICDKVNML